MRTGTRKAMRRTTALGAAAAILVLATSCTPAETLPTRQETSVTNTTSDATESLWRALATGNADAAREAIERGADIEDRGEGDATPLIAATKSRQVEAARVLIEAGADVNAQDAIQDSAFLYAGAEGIDEILEMTIAHGADVASTNRYGGTALIPASEHGHVSTVRLLISAGVPVNHVNRLGWTALHEAIVLGTGSPDHVETVRLLLDAGADPRTPDRDGVAPRELAAARGYRDMVALLDAALSSPGGGA